MNIKICPLCNIDSEIIKTVKKLEFLDTGIYYSMYGLKCLNCEGVFTSNYESMKNKISYMVASKKSKDALISEIQ